MYMMYMMYMMYIMDIMDIMDMMYICGFFLSVMGDPQVTIGVNTKLAIATWMISGTPIFRRASLHVSTRFNKHQNSFQ